MSTEPNVHSLAFVEALYARYLGEPSSVPEQWRRYFESLPADEPFARNPRLEPSFRPSSVFNPPATGNGSAGLAERDAGADLALQDRVDQLVRSYRVRGHMIARIDPLGLPREHQPELDPEYFGLGPSALERRFSSDTVHGSEQLTLRELLERLRNTYCRSIGVQFMHIDDAQIKNWLQSRMEGTENRLRLTRAEQLRILTRLTDAIILEDFIQKKFLGAKSFSLEGAESLIPLLELAIEHSGDQGVREIVLAMAHRGRLNVLANIMGKSPRQIFREFDETATTVGRGRGDVKYHLGYSRDWSTLEGRSVHLSLCFNPSHLEFVNPVALGRLRAKQDRVGDSARERGMVLMIHGDAAFTGEGILQETLNLSMLPAYAVGGTLHVIVNNQIGFTTPPMQARSSRYATSLAKMLQVPIFHVNGEDPEAVAQVVRLALDFRARYRRDVVIDMYCFRRRGHNEGDEPSFTQPLMYEAIRKRKTVRQSYLDYLTKMGEVTRAEADRIADERRQMLERELSDARRNDADVPVQPALRGIWSEYVGGDDADVPEVSTAVDKERISGLLERLATVPEGFDPHAKIARLLEQRREMASGARPLDWAAAESLAFGSLAEEGHPVRLTGQDSERGTFSHRHAVLHDVAQGTTWVPLQNLARDQAAVRIHNSPLSEAGVLGFEYGYSLDYPEALVAWEAQFGDFCNAAQVIIDQFLCSAEVKWQRLSGLVLLLPHGLEGMGPEHSSARLERFLTLAAEDNIQVVNLTTPAQLFHCLRRQVKRPWRKPLIVMSPKSLLRHPRVTSPLDELAEGRFHRILHDARGIRGEGVRRVLLCSGKVYYELDERRESAGLEDVAILRFEQLYPLQDDSIERALAPYPEDVPVYWVQEEPENMGAWPYLRLRFGESLHGRWRLRGIARPLAASPATGSSKWHKLEQEELVERALGTE
jgi:2-oxoglutarate dehydrogenase E1 component